MRGKWLIRTVSLWVATVLISGTVAHAGSAALETKMVNGELYVKASSLEQVNGGSVNYNAQTGKAEYITEDIPSVIKKISPSVVAIIGKPEEGGKFDLSHGTGMIVRSDGTILTNAHVVEDMSEMVVVTSDGKQYSGKKTHVDVESDLAYVKINAKGLKPVTFAPTSGLQVGETVIAIGTPVSFSMRNSATTGVISGLNRSMNTGYRLVQTDAAINPGNSGGPLVNTKGQVVGVNTIKFVEVSVDNMGFAIPADTAQYVMSHFDKYGKVKRAYLGFELDESWASYVGLSSTDPLLVKYVPTGEAAKAGIKKGDLLYTIGGKSVSTNVDINELLKGYLPGQKVELQMKSGGKSIKRTIVLQEK